MKFFLQLIGWYMVVIGILLVVRPKLGKQLANVWWKDKISRPWAIAPLAFGLGMLWAAPASVKPLFVQILGYMGIAKAVFLLTAPKDLLKKILEGWWNAAPVRLHRLWGWMAIAFGIALLLTL